MKAQLFPVLAAVLLAACEPAQASPTPLPLRTQDAEATQPVPATARTPGPPVARSSPAPTPQPSPEVAGRRSPERTPGDAMAILRDASGRPVGSAVFLPAEENQVQIRVVVAAMEPGQRGIHIHAVGSCEPPRFTSAGGHFNPANKQHGLENPQGPHAGDLPNLEVDPSGAGTLEVTSDRISLAEGQPNSLFDADGSALVIHAGPDDQNTDPAGNSGDRIACGEIRRA